MTGHASLRFLQSDFASSLVASLEQRLARVGAVPWSADPVTLDFTDIGARVESLFGYPRARWLEPGFWTSIVIESPGVASLDTCRLMVTRGLDHEMEYQIRCADGSVRWVQDIVCLERGPGGTVTAVHGLLLDITARKEAEIATWQDRDRLRESLKVSGAVMWNREFDSDRLTWFTAERDVFGYAPASLRTFEDFSRLVVPADRDMLRAARADSLANGPVDGTVQCRIVHADGRLRYVDIHGRPVWHEGKVSRIVGLIIDVTDRAMLLHDLRLRSKMLDALPIGIAVGRPDGTLVYANSAMEQMYGWKREELIGQNSRMLSYLTPGLHEEHTNRIRGVLGTGAVWNAQRRERRRDGSPIRVRRTMARFDPEATDTGETLYLSTRADVTEVHLLEREVLEASESARARLAQQLHERIGQKLAGAVLLAGRVAQLTEGVLPEVADLNAQLIAILGEAVGECRTLAQGTSQFALRAGGLHLALRSLAVECERNHSVPCRIEVDPVIVERLSHEDAQVLHRLVADAVHALNDGATPSYIDVQLRAGNDQAQLLIRDDGGVPLSETVLRRLRYRIGAIDGLIAGAHDLAIGRVIEGSFPLLKMQIPETAL